MTAAALAFMLGAGLVAAGAAFVYPPAGLIVAGLSLMAAGWLAARGARAES